MISAKLTSRGRITIPANVRAVLGLDAGSRVEFIKTGKGQFAIIAVTEDVQSLRGILKKPTKPVSIEEMNQAIATRRNAVIPRPSTPTHQKPRECS